MGPVEDQLQLAADAVESFVPLAADSGASLLVRLSGRDPQCLAALGPEGKPVCWQAASASEAGLQQARLAQLQQGLLGSNGTRRAVLQQLAAGQPFRTLTCGAESLAVLGYSGYDGLGGWCSRARELLQPGEPRRSSPVLMLCQGSTFARRSALVPQPLPAQATHGPASRWRPPPCCPPPSP
jgi:hypothetical protein